MGIESCSFRNEGLSPAERVNYHKLRQAIRNKDKDLVEHLVQNGAALVDGCYPVMPYDTPLHLAVISRCLDTVKILLSAGADICAVSRDGETPLTLAAKTGDILIIDLLLSYDLDNGENKNDGLSHLHVACMRNKTNIVRRLLLMEQGKSMNKAVEKNSISWAGCTPLHLAVQYGCTETVKYLLEIEVDFTVEDAKKLTPLHLAHYNRNEEIIDLLLRAHKYELRNPTDAQGLTHFHIACTRDDASVVEHFLKSGVDVNLACNSPNWKGWHPIHFAIYYECPKVVTLLLGTKIQLRDDIFFKLLKTAYCMNTEIYDLILKNRIAYNESRDYKEITNLQLACLTNNTEMIEIIRGEEVLTISELNVRIWTGCTPLHLALRCNSSAVSEFIVDYGADVFAQDTHGKTPFHTAFEHRRFNVLDKIMSKLTNDSPNLEDYDGLSIFHILCTTDHLVLIRQFLSRGANINIQVGKESACWAGFTPLHFAVDFLQPNVVELLLVCHADILMKNALNDTPFDLLINKLKKDYSLLGEKSRVAMCKILSTILRYCQKIRGFHSRGFSPLHAAYENDGDSVAIFKRYLSTHEDEVSTTVKLLRSRDFHKCSPLHLAMRRHLFYIAGLLMYKGADSFSINSMGETPLDMAASESPFWEIFQEEIASLFNVEVPIEKFKPSHFHIACGQGCLSVVQHVLDNAVDENLRMSFVNCRNDAGRTPLHTILHQDFADDEMGTEITRLLLENCANVNARDCELQTPLHLASSGTTLEAFHHLINYGADVNAQNLYGETPMHRILFPRKDTYFVNIDPPLLNAPDLIALFLENGADINVVDEQDRTWLMFEMDNDDDHDNCIELVLKHVKKLMVLGSFVCEENRRTYIKLLGRLSRDFNEVAFVDECKKELESMKLTRVNRYTTLHDILFKPLNSMALYCENTAFQELVESSEFSEKYPLYRFLIRSQLKNGKIRRRLLERSKKSLSSSLGRILPPACGL